MADGDIGVLAQDQGINLDPETLTFGSEGGTLTVGLSAVSSAAASWEVQAASVPDWCSVDPSSGELGLEGAITSVRVTAQENTSEQPRSGTIRFTDDAGDVATLGVEQEGAGDPFVEVSPSSLSFGHGDESEAVTVRCKARDTWYTDDTSLSSWCYVTPGSGANGDVATVHVRENTSSTPRERNIWFYTEMGAATYITVEQDGVAYITVSPDTLTFGENGGTKEFTVTGSGAWTVDSVPSDLTLEHYDADTGWAAVAQGTRFPADVETLMRVTVPSGDSRSWSIGFELEDGRALATLTVTRTASDALSCSPTSLEFPAEGGADTVRFSNPGDEDNGFSLMEDTCPDWLTVDPTHGSAPVEYTCVTCARNTSIFSRSAYVRFRSSSGGSTCTLHVTQEGYDPFKLQHYGEFPDIKGVTWRCEILRRDYTGGASDLTFPADRPLTIEWPSINFEDVMWGSSATLKVVSPGDRTYIDLYTIEPGSIRLDVYRNGSLYWSGMLDPEFYEEPYERLSGYEVELTFTDFGILDRLRYDLTGIQGIYDVITHAVEVSGIRVTDISRSIGINSLAGVCVNSENFTDEEGNVSTMYEAVEGILKPLGVRMCQREGRILLFDIDGILDRYDYGETAGEVEWAGDSQTLGVDRVYNSVTVTFSPYAVSGLADGDAVEYGGKYDADHTNSTSYPADPDDPDYGDYYSFWTAETTRLETDFTIFLSDKGAGVASLPTVWSAYNTYSGGRYFHILPVLGSVEECTGVLVSFRPYANNYNTLVGGTLITRYSAGSGIYTSERVWLPPTSEAEAARYRVRVEVPMLLDARQNPWDGDDPQTDNQETLEKDCRWVFLNAAITLYDDDGNAVSHYVNSGRAEGSNAGSFGGGSWEDGAGGAYDCWLEWYDPDDPEGSAGIGGWKSNRHCVGRPDGRGDRAKYSPSRSFREAADGEYLPYPASGGWLEVALYGGLNGYRWNEAADFRATSGTAWDSDAIYGWDKPNDNVLEPATIIRWWLVKAPTVEVVRNSLTMDAADCEDVEYRGTLNASAQDDLSIDTICGTCDGAPVTARGLFLNSDGTQVTELYRDRDGGRPERLLINQLYGQYAGRKTVLTGEAEIPGTLVLTERNQEGKTFILTADTQDIRMAVSDIEIRELGDDTYEPGS